ncbi:MAG: hypothetical protein MUD15_09085 [Desulfobacterota bacterium]|jgi:hypothetical protein|nr:hypothetical protein [Thermodesulfobacteriota bacterium]
MEEHANRGFIETKANVLGELLDKTAFKESLRLFLKSIDPESSPQLVRTLLGRDIEAPLSVVGALPCLANAVIKAACELMVQVRDKFPPPLLASFVESLLSDIDKDDMARLIKEANELARDLGPVFKASWKAVQDKAGQP